jgi:hypothetical protein
VAGGGCRDFLEQEGSLGVREAHQFGEMRVERCSPWMGGTMAVAASILARSGGLRRREVDKWRSGVESEASGSLLSWLSHREASSGVRRSGSSMLKRRGEREAVGAWISARPSGGGRGGVQAVCGVRQKEGWGSC